MRKRDKNRGSALAMTLVLMILLTYFSVLITDMAYTNVKLSKSYNEDRRMYRGTDYVVNMIDKRLRAAVKEMQDRAKTNAETELQKSSTLRGLHESSDYVTDLTEEGTVSYEDYDHEFGELYLKKYKAILEASKYVGDAAGVLSVVTIDELSRNDSEKEDGYYVFNLVGEVKVDSDTGKKTYTGEKIYYKVASGQYDKNDDTIEFVIYTKYESTNEVREGSMQQQTTTKVKFKLSDGRDNFNLLNSRVVNKKNDTLPAFTNQIALLSEKNVVFMGGSNSKNIDIVGDVVAFGYVPVVNKQEKTGSKWNEYGGVIFGYSPKLDKGNIFGTTWTGQEGSTKLAQKIDAGNVTIDGDVTTLGYVNIARNWGGSINICGDTYARQFVLSEDSHRADVWLGYGYGNRVEEDDSIVQYDVIDGGDTTRSKNDILGKGNLYVTDDLQVDSSFAKLVVEGDYYGLSDGYTSVGGTGGIGDDMSDERRTSTLNINGDSVVELRNKVYVGGTSVLTNIRKGNASGPAYVTGISGAKTSQISAEAYIRSEKNPNVYVELNNTIETKPAETDNYINTEETGPDEDKKVKMIDGYKKDDTTEGKIVGEKFNLNMRAQHFKEYFNRNVKNNFGLMGTMNFGNLRIKTVQEKKEGTEDEYVQKIQGWAAGVIIAAGVNDFNSILDTEEVNAYCGKDFTETETKIFRAGEEDPASQYSIIQKYQASLATFLETSKFGGGGRKIIQTEVDKHLTGYLNRSDSVLNDIQKKVKNGVYLHNNEDLDAHLYYSKNAKTVVSKSSNRIKIESNGETRYLENGYKKGIIFVEGDIFIEEGVEFEGVVIASGNITISGSAKITRKADVEGGDIVKRLIDEDYYVRIFFGENNYDIDENNIDVERIGQDYVKIVEYEVGYTQ